MRKYPNQKRKIAFSVFCLAVVIVICYFVFRQPGDMQDEPEPPKQTQQPQPDAEPGPGGVYTDQALAEDGQGELLNATWEIPDLHQQLQGETWQNVKEYYTELQRQKQRRLEQLKEQAQQQYDNLAGFIPYSLTESYEITRQDDAVLSILRVSEEYLGGATAQSVWQADNFSMADGSALSIDQMLREEASLSDLLTLVERQMAQQEQTEFFEDAERLVTEQFDPQRFYFTEKGLVLFYPAYVLGPYSEGPQAFVLEYDEIDEWLRQEYCP